MGVDCFRNRRAVRDQSVPCTLWLLGLGEDLLNLPLRKEGSLHSLYFWEYHAFHEVMSHVAPRPCRGPQALQCDAYILNRLRARRATGNELLHHFRIEVLHRVPTEERNKMLPNVSSVVRCRRISMLTQHRRFPVLGKVCGLGRWHWPIADFVNARDMFVESPLRQPLGWVLFESTNNPMAWVC